MGAVEWNQWKIGSWQLAMMMRLIVGLGNPGKEYVWSRHNLGFMLIDNLAKESGVTVVRRECGSLVGRAELEGSSVKLIKPQTFMNLIGDCRLPIVANCRLSIANWEILIKPHQVSDGKLMFFNKSAIVNRQSSIGNRQSAIVNQQLTIVNVLTGGSILETKRQYEVVFIVDPTADEEVPRLTDTFKQIVTEQGGVVTKAETMGKRQLAYEILHHKDGTFVLMEIEGAGREIA